MMHGLLLMGALLAGQVQMPTGGDLRADVGRLVRQLDSPKLEQRDAAEAALIGYGTTVLDVLPPANNHMSAEVRERLGRVWQKLQQQAASATAQSSTITLHADAMPLKAVLAAFQSQTGNRIDDLRGQFGQLSPDPALKVDFDRTPFWPALDRVLDQAGLSIYPYAPRRAIGVVANLGQERRDRAGRVSYRGPFRFEADSVVARRELRQVDRNSLVVGIDVLCEPRLRIINLMHQMRDVAAVDEQGKPLPALSRDAKTEMPDVREDGNASAVKLELPFQLPPRDAQRIARLQGKLLATLAGKTETFRFEKLAGAKNVEQRIAGVTVTLEQVRQEKAGDSQDASPHPNPLPKGEGTTERHPLPKGEGTTERHPRRAPTGGWSGEGTRCEVRLRVRFDDAGDALASHRQWIFSNPAYLEDAHGKRIVYDSYETTLQGKNEVGVAYLFHDDRPLAELTFVYETPGTIITGGFDYELRNIKLP